MATPIRLVTEICRFQDDALITKKECSLNLQETVLFEIQEAANVFVTFRFAEGEYQITLEPYDEREEIRVVNGERFCLSSGRQEKGCYFPGLFSIHISSHERQLERLFAVRPTNLKMESVENIRSYVNSFCAGLSRDLNRRKRKGGQVMQEMDPDRISDKVPQLQSLIHAYVRAMPQEAAKVEILTDSSHKPGMKSTQWLARKGLSRNHDISNPDKLLVSRTRFTFNSHENQVFRAQLLFWNKELGEALARLEKRQALPAKRINDEKIAVKAEELRIARIKEHPSISRTRMMDSVNSSFRLQKDIRQAEAESRAVQADVERIRRLKASIEYILFNTWVSQVRDGNARMDAVHDRRLRQLIELRKDDRTSLAKGEGTGYAEKCTPKLFETYTYAILLDQLFQAGYRIENSSDRSLLEMMSEAGRMVLKKGNETVEILYDTSLPLYGAGLDVSTFVSINSRHQKPDFILAFRDGENHIVRVIIVETKWRSLYYIYSRSADTLIMEQLKDYFNLGYYDSESGKLKRGIVDRVIVFYPDPDQPVTMILPDEIMAVGIMPDREIRTTAGYQNLRKLILAEQDDQENRP